MPICLQIYVLLCLHEKEHGKRQVLEFEQKKEGCYHFDCPQEIALKVSNNLNFCKYNPKIQTSQEGDKTAVMHSTVF